MYDKFTDRAVQVLKLANEEAEKLHHQFIGTEHILLALIAEGTGVGANVLKNLNIDLKRIRRHVEQIVAGPTETLSGTCGQYPLTPRSKNVIDGAIAEARALQHSYVGTEHLLLGLLREEEGIAALVLMNLGLNLNDAREEVCNLLGLPKHLAKIETGKTIAEPEPTEILKPEIQHLPTYARAIVDEFDCQLAAIKVEKEQAIAAQAFENAAQLRDLEVKLTKLRQEFIAQWPAAK